MPDPLAQVNPLAHIHNYTVPNWVPLEQVVKTEGLAPEVTGEFMWMCEHPQGVHQYKHCLTRRYVHLREGESLSAGYVALAFRAARAS